MASTVPAPPPSRRDRKKNQTRDALTAAALRLAAERGVEQVTVEEIADAADVSARTFFNYFSSKDEAITGRDPQSGQRLHDRIRSAPAHLDPLDTIRLALQDELRDAEPDRKQWRLRMTVVGRSPHLLARLTTLGQAEEQALVSVIAEREGLDPRSCYPQLLAAVLGTACRVALTRWGADGEARDLSVLVDETFDLLAAGLRPAATTTGGPA